ncbi:MAG: class I SAM-dependent methyltransferase [Acidobacteria bacterium]|nr:class I SAM-dependent methyltransferase [Acidobacteriota bacterium]
MRFIRPYLSGDLARQRVKLVWHVWGYLGLLRLYRLPLAARLGVIARFLRIDWMVPHAHRPREIATLCLALGATPARPGEVVVEAGCWQGGGSAKLSIACRRLGYRLHIYDSFAGVEVMSAADRARSFDFSGSFRASADVLQRNLARFGEPDVCTIHPGWFADTLAHTPVPASVKLAYIDCDLAKGTIEVLRGVLPSLAEDGAVFSQDCHIPNVFDVLNDAVTWTALGRPPARIERLGPQLARIHVREHDGTRSREDHEGRHDARPSSRTF